MSAAGQMEIWREKFDEDFWRNPRFSEPLRALASRSSRESLSELAEDAHAGAPRAYGRWVETSLGS